MMAARMPRVAVLIPCFNESVAIAGVVRAFAAQLPAARVIVYDNNSSDGTAGIAGAAGAEVRHEALQGKGSVLRRAFADVDADVYVLVDGDATYDAADAPGMVAMLLAERLDMVVARRESDERAAWRSGHTWGNRALTRLAAWIFGRSFTDMLSGYRVLSRRFVKSFPAHAQGFDVETELAVHALELRMPVAELPSRYRPRPVGSHSKLNTWRDGWRILLTILQLARSGRPLLFFSLACAVCLLLSGVLAWPLVETWLDTGLVPRFPTAILCAALGVLGGVFLVCGLVLDTVTLGRREYKRLAYLACPAFPADAAETAG